jgi:phage baseplate assembly protein W
MDTIINTDINERPFLVKNGQPYGTRIKRALFSPASVAASIISYEIPRALNLWEPRIIVQGTKCSQVNVATGVQIIANTSFRFRSTNRADNFVVPFLLVGVDQT